MYHEYHLENNARIIEIPKEESTSVMVLIMYPVGSRYEPKKLNGVSHYIEHLMFKGTAKRKTTLSLTREIDRLGASYNAFTSKEYTGYYIKTDKEYLKTSLDILSDMLFHSTFDPKEMEREKGPIVEELRMYQDNPIMNIDTIFEELMFDGSPLGWDIGGTPEHVMSYQRDEVLAFKEKFYQPGNMTVVIAGNINDQVRKWLGQYVESQAGDKSFSDKFKPAVFGSAKKQDRVKAQEKETDQVQFMMGFPGLDHNHKDRAIEKVMNTILGGSMSSRLFIKVRERHGLAYTVRSGAEHFRDTGYVYVQAGLEAKNLKKAFKLIHAEIEKLKEKGVTVKELADAKTHLRGRVSLSQEDSTNVAQWYAHQALFSEKMSTPHDWLVAIESVSAKDIQAFAKKYFKWNQVRIATIGSVTKDELTALI